MAKKPKVTKYVNLPVSPETYAKVALVSEAQGFGERGKGAFIERLIDRELPECAHEKQPVAIEYYPGETRLLGIPLQRVGYFCATCYRVYAKVEGALSEDEARKLLQAVKA